MPELSDAWKYCDFPICILSKYKLKFHFVFVGKKKSFCLSYVFHSDSSAKVDLKKEMETENVYSKTSNEMNIHGNMKFFENTHKMNSVYR